MGIKPTISIDFTLANIESTRNPNSLWLPLQRFHIEVRRERQTRQKRKKACPTIAPHGIYSGAVVHEVRTRKRASGIQK